MTNLGRVLFGVLVILLGVLTYRNIDFGHSTRVPDQLYGIWKTDNAEYTDRYLELSADQIVIGQGGSDSSTQTVSKVYTRRQGENTEYVIHAISYDPSFREEDKHEVVWALDFNPSGGGTIRLKNQPKLVWRKASSR